MSIHKVLTEHFLSQAYNPKTSAWNTVGCAPSDEDSVSSGLGPHALAPDPPVILYQTTVLRTDG
jgi:hypothetical protein